MGSSTRNSIDISVVEVPVEQISLAGRMLILALSSHEFLLNTIGGFHIGMR
jgi:hypothetical protein